MTTPKKYFRFSNAVTWALITTSATAAMLGALGGCGSKEDAAAGGVTLAANATTEASTASAEPEVATATPTPTPSPSPSPTPSPTPVPQIMFADTYSAGAFDNAWQNWSWSSTVTRDTTVKQSGTASLIVTITSAAYGGLKPYKAAPYSITDRTQISFDIYANDAATAAKVKSNLALQLEGPSITGKIYYIGNAAFTVTPSGAVAATTWYHVVAPISSLRTNATNGQPDLTVINSVSIFDAFGGTNLTFRIDNLTLE